MDLQQRNLEPDEEEKKTEQKFLLKRYLFSCSVAAVLVVAVCLINGLFSATDFPSATAKAVWVLTKLYDAFGIVGLIFVCLAGLLFCSRNGAYDMFAFGFRQTLGHFFLREEERKKYKDIHEYRAAKEKKRPEFRYLLWVGIALMAIAAVLFIIAEVAI